nr:MAG TPA: hypothetical protein [Bacteriophage sp.]
MLVHYIIILISLVHFYHKLYQEIHHSRNFSMNSPHLT